VVSLYDGDDAIVVEAVQRDERARLGDLDALPERIREWERSGSAGPGRSTGRRNAAPESSTAG
jgi:hypothetical protein